jgi:hypothetical protein
MKKKLLKECRGWLKVTEDFEHGDWLNCPRLQVFLLDLQDFLQSLRVREMPQ